MERLQCRMYESQFPQIDDVVMVQVRGARAARPPPAARPPGGARGSSRVALPLRARPLPPGAPRAAARGARPRAGPFPARAAARAGGISV